MTFFSLKCPVTFSSHAADVLTAVCYARVENIIEVSFYKVSFIQSESTLYKKRKGKSQENYGCRQISRYGKVR